MGRPSGKKKKALHACRGLKRNKKAHSKCVFDFLVLGKKAVKGNVRDRMAKRRMKGRKPTPQSVRDVSKWRNDAKWTSHPSWACASGLMSAKAKWKQNMRRRKMRIKRMRAIAHRRRTQRLIKKIRALRRALRSSRSRYKKLRTTCGKRLKMVSKRAMANFKKARQQALALKRMKAQLVKAKKSHASANKKAKLARKMRRLRRKKAKEMKELKHKKNTKALRKALAGKHAAAMKNALKKLRLRMKRARAAMKRKHAAALKNHRRKAHEQGHKRGMRAGLKRCQPVNGLMREVGRLRKKKRL